MEQLRKEFPERKITLEIHEAVAAATSAFRHLREALHTLDIRLAYDDFGAGRSRFQELAEVPPDVLKFDISLIRDIDKAPKKKQDMIALLVQLAKDMGAATLAEGVEREEEAGRLLPPRV